MRLLSKEVFIRHQEKRPPAAGFVTYASKTKPILMHCSGWEDYSDGYDDYAVSLSCDNGKTWSGAGSAVEEQRRARRQDSLRRAGSLL